MTPQDECDDMRSADMAVLWVGRVVGFLRVFLP